MEDAYRSLSGFFADPRQGGLDRAPITVTGSGGKTSFLWLLAEKRRAAKTLVTTTTNMYPPWEEGVYDRFWEPQGAGDPPAPLPGITLAGRLNRGTGKIEALPERLLAEMARGYDHVFIEGDGSAGRPLKAWAPYEPVVPPCTGLTLGILPLRPGLRACGEQVHRLPLFLALTGAASGEEVTPELLARVITGEAGRGLFSAARGKKALFFNQVEDEAALALAGEVVSRLPGSFRSGLDRIIAGSVREDRIYQVF